MTSKHIYYIYLTTNVVNGKLYVGSHKSHTLEFDGYLGSGKILQDAVKKYGTENFTRELLEVVVETNKSLSRRDWLETIYPRESHWINHYSSQNYILYNINVTGAWGGSTTHKTYWVYNPQTKEQKMIRDKIVPEGFIKGRCNGGGNGLIQVGGILYTNKKNGVEKRFKENPGSDWMLGSLKQLGRISNTKNTTWIINKTSKEVSVFPINIPLPPGFEPGHPGNKAWNQYTRVRFP